MRPEPPASRLGEWWRRLRAARQVSQLDAELGEELETHRALRQAALERDGLPADLASQVSRREMGSLLELRERGRDVWLGVGDTWWREWRRATRSLVRSPGFSLTTILTLAVGVAGATLMFALVQGFLLRPLPVSDEATLVTGWRATSSTANRRWPFRSDDLDLLRRESRSLAMIAGVGYRDPGPQSLVDGDVARYVQAARVTGEFFTVLGVPPLLGRPLTHEDDRTGAANALVLTERVWRDQFGASPAIIGRSITLNRQPFTVVGVMPDIDYPPDVDVWMTVAAMETTTPFFSAAMRLELNLVGRLRRNVSLAQASSDLQTLAGELERGRLPGDPEGLKPVLSSYREALLGDARPVVAVLAFAVILLLAVAWANVANLLLLRGHARTGEFALRAALGGGRLSLARQILTEVALIALVAGAAALAAAAWALPVLRQWPQGTSSFA